MFIYSSLVIIMKKEVNMAYKKYKYKNGKRFGPYYYESYRDEDGNVKKRYVGTKNPDKIGPFNKKKIKKIVKKKNLYLFFCIFFGVFILLLIGNLNYSNRIISVTGRISEEIIANSEDIIIAEQLANGEIVSNVDVRSIVDGGTNINSRLMEFDVPEGKIVLEFDLLDYAEWIETDAENEISAENFDIEVNESAEKYKWGYNVKLNDLNFMAKIDVKADNIVVIDNQTLKIGNNYLSFADLVEQNYIVRVEQPVILSEINLSALNITEINVTEVNITKINVSEINVSDMNMTNISEVNISDINISDVNVSDENITVSDENVIEVSEDVNISEEGTDEEINISEIMEEEIIEEEIDEIEEEINEIEGEVVDEEIEELEESSEENVEQPEESEEVEEIEAPSEESLEVNIVTNLIRSITGFFINGIRGITGLIIQEPEVVSVYVQRDFGKQGLLSEDNKTYEIGDVINLDPSLFVIMGANGSAVDDSGNVYQCGTINQSGSYTLNQSFSTTGTCLIISASDIVIDGAGYLITGDGNFASDYGITTPADSDLVNLTIRGFGNISQFGRGIYFDRVNDSLIYNNTMISWVYPTTYAIYLEDGDSNVVENNTIHWNATDAIKSSYGIQIEVSSGSYGNNNITGNNLTVNSVDRDSYGISLSNSGTSNSNTIQSNIFDMGGSLNSYGISLSNTGTSNSNTIQSNTFDVDSVDMQAYGIYLSNTGTSNSNTIQSNTFDVDSVSLFAYGIMLSNIGTSNSNTIYNETINVSSAFSASIFSAYGVYLYGIDSSNVSSIIINATADSAYASDVYLVSGSDDNVFTDSILQGVSWSSYIANSGGTNNSFVNVSFSGSEFVGTSAELIRKWYYRAYVTDTGSTPIDNASVDIYNGIDESAYLSLRTNSSGWINITNIIEYINNGIKTYYDNSVIAANSDSTLWDDHLYNVSDEQNNLDDSFIVDIDITPPILSGVEWVLSSTTSVNDVTAVINWTSDDPSNSSVNYGETELLGSVSGDNVMKGSVHSVTITGLKNDTVYYFNYTSCDFAENCKTNSSNFETPSPGTVSESGSSGGGIFCISNIKCGLCVNGIRVCVDENNCVGSVSYEEDCSISDDKPSSEPGSEFPSSRSGGGFGGRSCTANFKCSEWGVCQAVYDLEDIIEEKVLLGGEQQRTCIDKNNCEFDKVERQGCITKIPIFAKRVTRCSEEYVEIYDENDILISRMKLINGIYQRLEIQMLFDEFGYCPYCYDGIRNHNEDEMDCQYSGENCPVCSVEIASLRNSYLFVIAGLAGLGSLSVLFMIWYFRLWRKGKKRVRNVLRWSNQEEGRKKTNFRIRKIRFKGIGFMKFFRFLKKKFRVRKSMFRIKKSAFKIHKKRFKIKRRRLFRLRKRIIKKDKKIIKKERKGKMTFEEKESLARDVMVFERGVERLRELKRGLDGIRGHNEKKKEIEEKMKVVGNVPGVEKDIEKLKKK